MRHQILRPTGNGAYDDGEIDGLNTGDGFRRGLVDDKAANTFSVMCQLLTSRLTRRVKKASDRRSFTSGVEAADR
jgi:hypothetical protein